MKEKLSLCACHVCKGGNGGQFSFLVIQNIPDKDIRKQVLLEKGIDDGCEKLPFGT